MKSNINYLIAKKGYKKKYVADQMGISQNQLSNWITGRSYPPMDKGFKLAALLDCKVDDLYEYEDILIEDYRK